MKGQTHEIEKIFYNNKNEPLRVVITVDRIRLKKIQFFEAITIIIMVAIFFVGMTSNLSLNKTLDAFSHKNIFTAKLKFIDRSEVDDEPENLYTGKSMPLSVGNDTNVNVLHKVFKNILNKTEDSGERIQRKDEVSRPSRKGYRQNSDAEWNFDDDSYTYGDKDNQISEQEPELTDEEFLERKQVNLIMIRGRRMPLQDYLVFYPLMTLIVATSWGTLLICFRSGGYCNDEWVSIGPWRIVIPSMLCFGVMSIASSIYVFLSYKYTNRLCQNIGSGLTYPGNYTCGYLLEKLAPFHPFHVLPTHTQFEIYRVSVKIDLVLWILALAVMSARWFLAVDFELVKIALSPYCMDDSKAGSSDYEDATTMAETKMTQLSTEPDRSTITGGTPKKRTSDSRDDLDDFQSAHSYLTTNDPSGQAQEFSSLEPLMQRRGSYPDENDGKVQTDTV